MKSTPLTGGSGVAESMLNNNTTRKFGRSIPIFKKLYPPSKNHATFIKLCQLNNTYAPRRVTKIWTVGAATAGGTRSAQSPSSRHATFLFF